MDPRRMNTAEALDGGILSKPAPKTEIPDYREEVHGRELDAAAVAAAVEAGKVVTAPNYYGIPNVWKDDDGIYRGALLQYRNVTESPTFESADEAAEWFRDRNSSTDG